MQVDILKEGWERKEEATCTWPVTTLGLNTSLKQLRILYFLEWKPPLNVHMYMYACLVYTMDVSLAIQLKKHRVPAKGVALLSTCTWMCIVRISNKMLRVQAWEADLFHPAALNASSMPDTASARSLLPGTPGTRLEAIGTVEVSGLQDQLGNKKLLKASWDWSERFMSEKGSCYVVK